MTDDSSNVLADVIQKLIECARDCLQADLTDPDNQAGRGIAPVLAMSAGVATVALYGGSWQDVAPEIRQRLEDGFKVGDVSFADA